MTEQATKKAAGAIQRHAAKHAGEHAKKHQLAQVLKVNPLKVSLMDADIDLDEDDIHLGQSVRGYHNGTGLKKGDNLVMHRVSGHWTAVDVLSDENVTGGVGPPGPSGEPGAPGAPGADSTVPGPAGPPGADGADGVTITYIHDQSTPADPWTITHNLGQYPSVTTVDSGGTVVDGDIHYVNSNQLTVTFGAAFGGKAYLN